MSRLTCSWLACIAFVCALLISSLSLALAAEPGDKVIALKAARLFDGKSKALVPNGVVIVQGDKITDAGSNLPTPSGAQVIDLGDATLSPGFMDAHTHLTGDFSGNYQQTQLRELQQEPAKKAYAAISHARATLEAGFTTVRDAGAGDFVDVALREAIANGTVVGPRMLLRPKGSARPEVTSMMPTVFAMNYSENSPISPAGSPTAPTRFAAPSGIS